MLPRDHRRRVVAEALGTAFLLAAIVGSGIMGERLAGGNAAIALLANTLATGAALVVLSFTFGPISGAHLNPWVTIADASQGGLPWTEVPGFVLAAAPARWFRWLVPSLPRTTDKVVGGPARETNRKDPIMSTHVIFACVHNAGRSQMAAAFFNSLADPARAHASSAGTDPGARVHPEVADAMREVGIDLSAARPQRLTGDLARTASWLITMGCGDQCPHVPGARRDDWPIPDPKGKTIAEVRTIRDAIAERVRTFMESLGMGEAMSARVYERHGHGLGGGRGCRGRQGHGAEGNILGLMHRDANAK